MQVGHEFVKLSERESGKQHCFTWSDDEGKFLCHAMYQSGSDLLDLPGGHKAVRGKILRIHLREVPHGEAGNKLAPSCDTENGTIRLQVDGDGWDHQQYEAVAKKIIDYPGWSRQLKSALLAQTASLYNLMATRYGVLFDQTLPDFKKESVNNFITDARMRWVSQAFASFANDLMQGHPPDTGILAHIDHRAGVAPKSGELRFEHGIKPRNEKKVHTFAIKNAKNETLITAQYQSGTLGESILIDYPLIEGKRIAVPYNLMVLPKEYHDFAHECTGKDWGYEEARDLLADLYQPVGARYQLQKLDFYRQMYNFSPEQQAATLLMLASVTRLFATRFQRGFEPIPVMNGEQLRDYISNKTVSAVADQLLAAATKMLQEKRITYPFLTVGHPDLGTGKAVKRLKAGRPVVDMSLYPPWDACALMPPVGPNTDLWQEYGNQTDIAVYNIPLPPQQRIPTR